MSYIDATSCPTEEEMQQEIKVQYVWHMHHDILFETVILDSFEDRVKEIKAHKKNWEQRLKLMQYIKMEIPKDLLEAATKQWALYRELCWLDRTANLFPAGREEARVKWVDANREYEDIERKYLPQFYLAHAQECSNCKWNGYTLFPN